MPKLIGRNGNGNELYRRGINICHKVGNYYWATLLIYLLIMFNERLNNPSYGNIKFNFADYIAFNKVFLVMILTYYVLSRYCLAKRSGTVHEIVESILFVISCFLFYKCGYKITFHWYLNGEESTERLMIFLLVCGVVKAFMPNVYGKLLWLIDNIHSKVKEKRKSHKKHDTVIIE